MQKITIENTMDEILGECLNIFRYFFFFFKRSLTFKHFTIQSGQRWYRYTEESNINERKDNAYGVCVQYISLSKFAINFKAAINALAGMTERGRSYKEKKKRKKEKRKEKGEKKKIFVNPGNNEARIILVTTSPEQWLLTREQFQRFPKPPESGSAAVHTQ